MKTTHIVFLGLLSMIISYFNFSSGNSKKLVTTENSEKLNTNLNLLEINKTIQFYLNYNDVPQTDTMWLEIAFNEPMGTIGLFDNTNYIIRDLQDSSIVQVYAIYSDYIISEIPRNVDGYKDTLLLKTGRHANIGNYELTVNNVTDTVGNVINPAHQMIIYQLDNLVPVELVSFDLKMNSGFIYLYWTTATEINNYGFEVQRSDGDASHFKEVAFLNGFGNSNIPHVYTYYTEYDMTLYPNHYYFRLKQIDNDGTYDYSQIRDINLLTTYYVYQNFPNPFNGTTLIPYYAEGDIKLQTYSILGELLHNDNLESGVHIFRYNHPLAGGRYVYRLIANSQIIGTKMFTVLK